MIPQELRLGIDLLIIGGFIVYQQYKFKEIKEIVKDIQKDVFWRGYDYAKAGFKRGKKK